ncbi:MAG: sigma-70 family RNA polymerase sigma factor [Myxococcota bacterium]
MNDERTTFESLYRDHFEFVLANLRRLGVASSQLEDAAQDVFVVAYRRLPQFEGRSSPRTWLFGIARRIAYRYRRTRARSQRRRRRLAQDWSGASDDLERELERRQAGELLSMFLDTLSPDQREAFILGELEQLGRHELGAALGVNPNTAYSRLRLARERLVQTFHQPRSRRELLARWRTRARPDPQRRERVLALVIARLPTAAQITATETASSSVSAWSVTGVLTVVAVIAMGAVKAIGPGTPAHSPAVVRPLSEPSAASRRPHKEPPPPPALAERPERPEIPDGVPVAEGSARAPSRVATGLPAARREPKVLRDTPVTPIVRPAEPDLEPPTAAAAPDVHRELADLKRAREALRRGQADVALGLLGGHHRRFPDSMFARDRGVLEIEALCATGAEHQARTARRRFLAEHGASPQAARVEKLCPES